MGRSARFLTELPVISGTTRHFAIKNMILTLHGARCMAALCAERRTCKRRCRRHLCGRKRQTAHRPNHTKFRFRVEPRPTGQWLNKTQQRRLTSTPITADMSTTHMMSSSLLRMIVWLAQNKSVYSNAEQKKYAEMLPVVIHQAALAPRTSPSPSPLHATFPSTPRDEPSSRASPNESMIGMKISPTRRDRTKSMVKRHGKSPRSAGKLCLRRPPRADRRCSQEPSETVFVQHRIWLFIPSPRQTEGYTRVVLVQPANWGDVPVSSSAPDETATWLHTCCTCIERTANHGSRCQWAPGCWDW